MIDNTLLLFVLPFIVLAFLLGHALGRKKYKNDNSSSSYALCSDYFKGLNYLLNEQTDKAIDVFIRLLEVGEDTFDTHISLGNIYRKRGEVEKAIKVHQNIISQSSLSVNNRNDALYELARDFMNAGLLDRAEDLLNELIEKQSHVKSALNYLLSIYQQEHDWDAAIITAKKLEAAENKTYCHQIAHFYCELSLLKQKIGQRDEALNLTKKALGADKQSARASIIEGDIQQQLGHYKEASRAFRRVEQQDPLLISEVLDSLIHCYKELENTQEITAYLEHTLEKFGNVTSVLLYAEQIRMASGNKPAALFVVESLRQKSSIRGLNYLINISLDFTKGSAHKNLLILQEITNKLMDDKPVYKCTQCGFKGNSMFWHCPGCKSWGSIKPIQGIEGE